MKITILLTVLTVLHVNASLYSQATKFDLSIKEKPVRDVLKMIEEQSNFRFFYNEDFTDLNKVVTVAFSEKKINEVLNVLLDNSGVTYKIFENDVVVITPAMETVLKQLNIRGTVTDGQTNEPLPGVNIIVEGTTIGVTSDLDGKYSIDIAGPGAVLVFSYIGYVTQKVTVSDQAVIDVKLLPDVETLDEVVVIGYGVQKKKLTTGANLNVKGERIQELNTTNAMDALKGITPGVNITQTNAQPGAKSKVYIRGIGTTGNSDPLYIVDGVIQGNIDYLNPNDIESLDVLKDAASAAIYGSRGANGVILVTTKQGRKNMKAQVTYDGYTGWQNVYRKPDLLNAQEYAFIVDEARVNQGLAPHDFTALVPDWDRISNGEWAGTNWFDEMMVKDAPVQSHALSIIGGSERSTYSIGASYIDQNGVFGKQANPFYTRTNLRLNTEHILFSRGTNDIIVFGENLTYTNTKTNTIRQGNIYFNDVHNAVVASPFLPLYDENGKYHMPIEWDPTYGVNPAGLMEYERRNGENNNNQIVGSAYVVLQPVKSLRFRSNLGINAYWGGTRTWVPDYDLGPVNNPDGDRVTQNVSNGSSILWDNTLTYSLKLNNHNISAMIGNSIESSIRGLELNAGAQNTFYQDWEHAYISNTNTSSPVNLSLGGRNDFGYGLLSYFGRISYDYKETYLFTLMMRADGSSRFAKGKRWGTFPSVSAGWVLSNESFMSNASDIINFLKVRGSWGQVGNERIKSFQYSSTMGYLHSDPNQRYYIATYSFGSKTDRLLGSFPARIPNPDITWETSEQLNFGLDATFLRSRLQATFDWYKKDTKNWLVDADVPTENGVATMTINGGQITNTGVELALNWNDRVSDFKYGGGVSFTYNKNEVTAIANSEKIIHGPSNVLSQGTGEMFRAQVDYPIGYFWGLQTAGVIQDEAEAAAWVAPEGAANAGQPYYPDQRPGDLKWVDQNSDGVINDLDKVMIGNPNPDVILGIQLNLEYKGIFFNATANGAFGQQIAKSYRSFADSYKNNYTTDVLGRWHGKGTSNKIPRLNSSPHRNTQNLSDLYIQDGDYLRISNITIGYDLKNLIRGLPANEVRLYFTAKNLYTFTKYDGMDPEIGYGDDINLFPWASGIDLGLYPSARTLLIGLSLKF